MDINATTTEERSLQCITGRVKQYDQATLYDHVTLNVHRRLTSPHRLSAPPVTCQTVSSLHRTRLTVCGLVHETTDNLN